MSRKLCLISPKIGELLVKQLEHEMKNYNLYRSFANYFGIEGYSDLEEYYQKRAAEEMLHHEWCFKYLSEGDFKFKYPAISENTETFSGLIEPFKLTVDREILTTDMIYKIYDAAMEEKDYMTATWLYEKLIKEQIEEENTSRMALTIMEESSDVYIKAKKVLELLA